MNQIGLRMSGEDWKAASKHLLRERARETAGAVLCGISEGARETQLLVRRVLGVPDAEYVERSAYHLEIAPSFYNRLIDQCARENLIPVVSHSHPGVKTALYSPSDDYGESRLLPVLSSLVPRRLAASLLVASTAAAGRTLGPRGFVPFSEIVAVGQRIQALFSAKTNGEDPVVEKFDRQVRAFGNEGQRTLQSLRVGIVGLGGTGSVVAEVLVRTGIKDLILIDDDKVEESNVSRLFGSTVKSVGLKKVGVIRKHLLQLGASTVQTVSDNAVRQQVLMKLRDRRIIFSCVDNDRSRAILARFAYQYLIPMIDVGIRLDGRSGDVRAAAGRVSVVGAGLTCLSCSSHVSAERIRAESLPADERRKLELEGYIMGIDEPAPAVASLNAVVAGMAVTAGLNLFVNLTGAPQPADQLYDATTGVVFVAKPVHLTGCDVCDSEQGVKGIGDGQIVSAYD